MLNGSDETTEGILSLGNDLTMMESTGKIEGMILKPFLIIPEVHTIREKCHFEIASPRKSTPHEGSDPEMKIRSGPALHSKFFPIYAKSCF
ncbi:hypothetical protein B9Z55_009358 [Caenorhabditis nigoni]|uniref:Uncharacterized protein n=1 Tax=Caenorhabditis nigoni TaxID=1611254 RepID=A0A2G5URT1_9PELO|nr:hypothetical protein B9Z55_009358 [Caenorhabditis nigoni]